MPNHLHLEDVMKLMKKALADKNIKLLEQPYFIQDNLISSERNDKRKGNDLVFNVSAMFKGETSEGSISIFEVSVKVSSFESDWYVENQAYCDADVVTFPEEYLTDFEVVDILQEGMNMSGRKYNNYTIWDILCVTPERKRFGTLSSSFSVVLILAHLDGFEAILLKTHDDEDGKFIVTLFNELNYVIEYDNDLLCRVGDCLRGYEFCGIGFGYNKDEETKFKDTLIKFNKEFVKDFDFIPFITHNIIYKNDHFAIINHNGEYYILPKEYSEIPLEEVEKFDIYRAPRLDVPSEIESIIPIKYTLDTHLRYGNTKPPYHLQKCECNGITATECVYTGNDEYDETIFNNPSYSEYIIKYKDDTQSLLQVNREEINQNKSEGPSRTNTRFKHIRY